MKYSNITVVLLIFETIIHFKNFTS